MAKKCPREGMTVVFGGNAVARALYSGRAPRDGERGKVITVPVPGGRKTCMAGPRGGLVYVRWEQSGVEGAFRADLRKTSGGLLGGCGGRRRARRKRSRR